MTDEKIDRLMKDAKDVLKMMPEAHNFSHRTVYDDTALTTSWYLEDSKMKELMVPEIHPWAAPNPVEKFVGDCEAVISALVGALNEKVADYDYLKHDYDSLEQQYNEYKATQPSETAKNLYDHVNGRGIQLIDILVDRDKAHLKVENQKLPEKPVTTLEEICQPDHRTIDDECNTGFEEISDGLNYFLSEYDNYVEHTAEKTGDGFVYIRCTRPRETAKSSMLAYNLTDLAAWLTDENKKRRNKDGNIERDS